MLPSLCFIAPDILVLPVQVVFPVGAEPHCVQGAALATQLEPGEYVMGRAAEADLRLTAHGWSLDGTLYRKHGGDGWYSLEGATVTEGVASFTTAAMNQRAWRALMPQALWGIER